jgi:hypothetical protein
MASSSRRGCALERRHLDVLRIAAQLLDHDLVLQQLLADALALASACRSC